MNHLTQDRINNQNDANGDRGICDIEYGEKSGVDEICNMTGKSQPVKFILTESAPGNYAVNVGGLSAEFRVAGDSGFEPTSDWSSTAVLVVVCLAGLMIAIVLLRDIFIKR